MLKRIILLTFSAACLFAEVDFFPQQQQRISVQNKILTKVNGNIISVVDVMKKMDMALHRNYPQYADSMPARYQFYTSSWRNVLMEMIDTELILADAKDKEIKLTDGDVREEIENRFGPNVLQTLEGLRLSYDDAWKMVRNEMIMQRMLWFFVQSKAMSSVSPGAIRQSYQAYLQENPPYEELKYRVITIKGDSEAAMRASRDGGLEGLMNLADVQVSNEFVVKGHDLSQTHREVLGSLEPGAFSLPISAVGRDGKSTVRMFFLAEREAHPAPSFEELSPKLKNELTQKAMVRESEAYLGKLRKHYGYDADSLRETVPSDLQPFSLF